MPNADKRAADRAGLDPERFYCPYPGCNRSFAELWRLKVHYRAPPDVRGSGKERGHGTELDQCPKCGKELKPGKHHVGCSAGRSAPRQAAKRTKLDREPSGGRRGGARGVPQGAHDLLFGSDDLLFGPPPPLHGNGAMPSTNPFADAGGMAAGVALGHPKLDGGLEGADPADALWNPLGAYGARPVGPGFGAPAPVVMLAPEPGTVWGQPVFQPEGFGLPASGVPGQQPGGVAQQPQQQQQHLPQHGAPLAGTSADAFAGFPVDRAPSPPPLPADWDPDFRPSGLLFDFDAFNELRPREPAAVCPTRPMVTMTSAMNPVDVACPSDDYIMQILFGSSADAVPRRMTTHLHHFADDSLPPEPSGSAARHVAAGQPVAGGIVNGVPAPGLASEHGRSTDDLLVAAAGGAAAHHAADAALLKHHGPNGGGADDPRLAACAVTGGAHAAGVLQPGDGLQLHDGTTVPVPQ